MPDCNGAQKSCWLDDFYRPQMPPNIMLSKENPVSALLAVESDPDRLFCGRELSNWSKFVLITNPGFIAFGLFGQACRCALVCHTRI